MVSINNIAKLLTFADIFYKLRLRTAFVLLLTLYLPACVVAQSRSIVETSTDIAMFIAPAAGLATSLALDDKEGVKQLFIGGATTVVVDYLLKYTIKKERPDASDNHAFPSNHTGVAFYGATFIGRRYGWKYSIPAYAIATYVAWGRVYAKRHDVWDTLAGAAIGSLSGYFLTSRFNNLSITPMVSSTGGCGISLALAL